MLWPATLLIYSYNFGTCLETAIIIRQTTPICDSPVLVHTPGCVVGIYFLMNPNQ